MRMICGIDEAGRGPLAGPVTAAAVILGTSFDVGLLADSKALPVDRREALRTLITRHALAWGVGWAGHREIDLVNIHHATLAAMRRAFGGLSLLPDEVLVDGKFCPDVGVPCRAIVRGDREIAEIQAASILAKTIRDAWMRDYALREPVYRFERHKGYPTVDHRTRILRYGPSRIQRLSFTVSAVSSAGLADAE